MRIYCYVFLLKHLFEILKCRAEFVYDARMDNLNFKKTIEANNFVKIKSNHFIYYSTGNTMTTEKIVERIIKHRIEFEQRNLKKEKKEIEAYEALTKAKQNEKAG